MTAPSPWLAKSHRLEQDRRLLLNLWSALDRAEMGLNGSASGLVDTPEFRALFQRVEAALTAIDAQQREYLAHYAGDEESGRKGASVGDLEFVRWMDSTAARALAGRQTPVISRALLESVRQAAERQQMGLRTWIEGALAAQLKSGGNHRPTPLTLQIRDALREGPATVRELAERLGAPQAAVAITLRHLARPSRHEGRALVAFAGKKGSRFARWVSLEEP